MTGTVKALRPESNEQVDALAALLKAAGDPLRLQILRVLHNNAFGALELSRIFSMRQNAMSHHLKLLSRARLVTSRREGTHIFYRRDGQHDELAALRREIHRAADDLPLPESVQQALDQVQTARAAASRAFFRSNADKFRAQQDLIASYPKYGEAVLATLDRYAPLGDKTVLEVGPGEGELLPALSRRFARVVALDNSAEMLDRSSFRLGELDSADIELVFGDTSHPRLESLKADVITVNMVLHHTAAPASVLADLSRVLTEDGLMVVTELCRHNQDWARDACGDIWLGFDTNELGQWAADAGLSETGREFLALKNGFTIQIRQFRGHEPGEAT